jgi:ATP-binding cassette, subfamily B, bacterial PglK
MTQSPSVRIIFHDLKRLWVHLQPRRRFQASLILILMVFASISEIISIGAVLPFLGVLTNPVVTFEHQYAQIFIEFLNIASPGELLLPVTLLFIFATFFSALIRVSLLYLTTRLAFNTGSDLSVEIYQKTLYQNYMVHVSRNSSEVINGIVSKISAVIYDIINASLNLVSSVILVIGIITAIFIVDTEIAIYSIGGFSLMYLMIIKLTRNTISKNSKKIAIESTNMIKALQEGLGGIRDVLIDGNQKAYCDIYRKSDVQLRRAHGINQFLGASPRFIVESIGMIFIVLLAYFISQRSTGISAAIPLLGALALGAQRLLPVSQAAFNAVALILGAHSSLKDVLKLLDQKIPSFAYDGKPEHISFNRSIELRNISFRYSDDSVSVIKDLNININKGSIIGFVGETGCGKSTLLDILMGLLTPTKGKLLIDGHQIEKGIDYRRWQRHIAHVPQFIYLSDGTIADNIILGANDQEIDHDRLRKAVSQASLLSLIESWPDKFNTIVGENGVKLSGGQRQRIGIARALYKNANVLILDEATSALDISTEKSIMNSIINIDTNITILIIAHRISTLDQCDQIIKLNSKKEVKTYTYEDFINKK